MRSLIHPLLRKLVTQPQLFMEHADGYGELASIEARVAARSLRLRAVLALAALACAIGGLCLAGMSLLLVAALPVAGMPMPALLVAVPAVVLVAAAVCGWLAARAPEQPLFAQLREQWQADRQLLRELGRGAEAS